MNSALIQEVITGLESTPPFIAPKFFYDELGSKLFEAITLLEEYYPTKVEKFIMQLYTHEILQAAINCDALVDYHRLPIERKAEA